MRVNFMFFPVVKMLLFKKQNKQTNKISCVS